MSWSTSSFFNFVIVAETEKRRRRKQKEEWTNERAGNEGTQNRFEVTKYLRREEDGIIAGAVQRRLRDRILAGGKRFFARRENVEKEEGCINYAPLSLSLSCFGMDDVRLTFQQDIFEAVSSASILHCSRPAARERRPSARISMPTTLSTLEACQSFMSIYILPPAPLSLSYAAEETSPTGNIGKTKKTRSVGRAPALA